MHVHVAATIGFALDSDRKMSEFPNQPPAPDSQPDPAVEADALALTKIRSMCAVARESAEDLAQAIDTDMTRVNRLRFASAKRMSLELARTIAEASYRDAALRHIIELCMTANDIEASAILLQGIQSQPIRDELLLAHPALFS